MNKAEIVKKQTQLLNEVDFLANKFTQSERKINKPRETKQFENSTS